jgi:hypothetical protein
VNKCGIILLILTLVLCGCGQGKKRNQKKADNDTIYNAPVKGIKLQFDDPKTGKPLWRLEIESGSATFQVEKGGYGQLKGLKGVLYENGKPAIRISADICDYDTEKQTLRAVGHVEGISFINRVSFKADKIFWRAKLNEITAEGQPVIIFREPGFELRDVKLIANTSLKNMHN